MKELVLLLPLPSLAVQTTVVVPTANVLPLAGVHITVGDAEQLSVAVAVKLTTAPAGLVRVTVMLPGTVSTGAMESVMVSVTTLLVVEPPLLLTTT